MFKVHFNFPWLFSVDFTFYSPAIICLIPNLLIQENICVQLFLMIKFLTNLVHYRPITIIVIISNGSLCLCLCPTSWQTAAVCSHRYFTEQHCIVKCQVLLSTPENERASASLVFLTRTKVHWRCSQDWSLLIAAVTMQLHNCKLMDSEEQGHLVQSREEMPPNVRVSCSESGRLREVDQQKNFIISRPNRTSSLNTSNCECRWRAELLSNSPMQQ